MRKKHSKPTLNRVQNSTFWALITEELVKHRSDLKHASMARAQAEDREKKARKDMKVAKNELWLAREELQAVKGDMCTKVTTLDRVCKRLWRLEISWNT